MRFRICIGAVLSAFGLALSIATPARADWKPQYRTETYAVPGRTGIALYQSIGHRGPTVGNGIRAIAHTNFKLTWTRKYEVRGDACVLAIAVPHLTIITTLPRAAEALPEPTRSNWRIFVDGIAAHERGHGAFIEAMTRRIEQETLGLTVPADPGCRRIKTEMNRRLGAISRDTGRQHVQYDAAEMGKGGTIERLVLALVNGG